MPHPNGPAHEMGDARPPKAKLEERYLVLKLKDVGRLPKRQRETLYRICTAVRAMRIERGAHPDNACIVVEKDWPEYEPTLAAILARADREVAPGVSASDGQMLRGDTPSQGSGA